MKDTEAVAVLKETYPGMSKSVLSMGRNPIRYGVELTPDAKRMIGLTREDRRRKPFRLTVRLSAAEFEQFELARGCDTRQDFLSEIVKQALQIGG